MEEKGCGGVLEYDELERRDQGVKDDQGDGMASHFPPPSLKIIRKSSNTRRWRKDRVAQMRWDESPSKNWHEGRW